MINLSYRQEKIQAKRKQTPWRDFVMEIASHFPVNLYRNGSFISKYPNTDRVGKLVLAKDRNNYSIISKDYS